MSSTPATRSCPPESSLYLSDAFPNQDPNADLTLELKVCTIKSESPSPVVHSCHDLEQYVQFLELMEEAYEDGLFVGREEGISIGLERGAYQTKLETARKRIARGNPAEDIADVTGLSLLQIKELMAE
ncbi:MAG: hypothetical protein J6C11_05530 [Spirochaetaceae bacterium]|nr:hypothetical protein [Spirochaetaceae bacterium]